MKSQYVTIIVASGVTGLITWAGSYLLNSPAQLANAYSSLDTRITTLETTKQIDHATIINQGNKVDYVVNAVSKIATRLNVDVGSPPINR